MECGLLRAYSLTALGARLIRVAFAENGVHRTSLDLVVASLNVTFLIRFRLFRIVGQIETFGLQF